MLKETFLHHDEGTTFLLIRIRFIQQVCHCLGKSLERNLYPYFFIYSPLIECSLSAKHCARHCVGSIIVPFLKVLSLTPTFQVIWKWDLNAPIIMWQSICYLFSYIRL